MDLLKSMTTTKKRSPLKKPTKAEEKAKADQEAIEQAKAQLEFEGTMSSLNSDEQERLQVVEYLKKAPKKLEIPASKFINADVLSIINEYIDMDPTDFLRKMAKDLSHNTYLKNILIQGLLEQQSGSNQKEKLTSLKTEMIASDKKQQEEVKTLSVPAAVSQVKKMEKDAIEQEIAVEAATADTVQQSTPIEQLQEQMTLATVGTANPIVETSSMSAEAVNIQLNQDITQVAEPVTTNIDASQVAINTDQATPVDGQQPSDAQAVPGPDQVPNPSSDATISGQGTGFTGQGAVYHRTAIAIFFNNADTPDWDTQLNSNIESSGASAEEMSKMMSDIVASEGPLILVNLVKSATMQEFKEIMQLHFSLHRQMSRGSRVPTIGVPLGSLLNFRNQVSGSGDASLKPYIPVSSQGSQATPIVKPDLAKAWDNRAHWQNGPSKPSMYYAIQEQAKPIIYDERGSGGPTKELRGLMILPTGQEECE